jgi:hypothetical protein
MPFSPGTIPLLWCRVTTAATSSSTVTLRKNSANASNTFSINANTSKQFADVIEQHANTFDMKFVKLLDIVKTGLVDQDEATRSFISGEIVKMMPRKLTTKELQEIEALRNLTGVFIDITDSNNQV